MIVRRLKLVGLDGGDMELFNHPDGHDKAKVNIVMPNAGKVQLGYYEIQHLIKFLQDIEK